MDFTFLPNYFTLGALISTLFMAFLSFLIFQMPKRSKATNHLGYLFLFMFFFYLSYVLSHGFSNAPTYITRWTSILSAMGAGVHALQFLIHFPNETKQPIAKVIFWVQYAVTLVAGIIMAYTMHKAPYYYLFNSHFWESDSLEMQKYLGVVNLLFFVLIAVVGTVRTIMEKGKTRYTILSLNLAFIMLSVVPGILNVLSRDGLIERSVYMVLTVILNLIGYFIIFVLYINSTRDRSTILARLIGVSVVSIMLIMQALCFLWINREEVVFDNIQTAKAIPNIENSEMEESTSKGFAYVVQFDTASELITKKWGDLQGVNAQKQLISLRNTSTLLRILHMKKFSENEFHDGEHYFSIPFAGYRGLIREYQKSHANASGPDVVAYLKKNANQVRYRSTKLRGISQEVWDWLDSEDTNLKKNDFFNLVEKALPGFASEIKNSFAKEKKSIDYEKLELAFLPLRLLEEREYRGNVYFHGEKIPSHFLSYIVTLPSSRGAQLAEVGYHYQYYREQIAKAGWQMLGVIVISFFFILIGFRFFFSGALLRPIQTLVNGLREVNKDNLNVRIKVNVQDEIGYMASSFNRMARSIKVGKIKLRRYADQLEDKVRERTQELQQTLNDVQKLKQQQDGDYFLTTLLLKPLGNSRVDSKYISLESYVRQKKHFTFRHWSKDIGGDLNIAHKVNLRGKPHIAFANSDAMGKSIQGAGGALVLGSVYHTIIDRTLHTDNMQNLFPERWLKNLVIELHKVFETFEGSMLISGIFGLLDEESGLMYYLNCEHPDIVLYRDEKATFLNDMSRTTILRKLGTTGVVGSLRIQTFQMEMGDVLIFGSDGKDDLILGTDEDGNRIINEDEKRFVEIVQKSNGNLPEIVKQVKNTGELVDDLSIMRIERRKTPILITDTFQNKVAEAMRQANDLVKASNFRGAIELLEGLVSTEQSLVPQVVKSLARLYYHVKDYTKAAKFAQDYLFLQPADSKFVYFASLCYKRIQDYEKSIDLSERLRLRNENFTKNLGLLADLHLRMDNLERAKEIFQELVALEPEAISTMALKKKIENTQG